MPLARDEGGGGTEKDGTKSTMYCSHCYRQGTFTLPNITIEQMQERVKGKIKEAGFPLFMGWFFARNVPKLERWRGKIS